jgi:hypothetical protein
MLQDSDLLHIPDHRRPKKQPFFFFLNRNIIIYYIHYTLYTQMQTFDAAFSGVLANLTAKSSMAICFKVRDFSL